MLSYLGGSEHAALLDLLGQREADLQVRTTDMFRGSTVTLAGHAVRAPTGTGLTCADTEWCDYPDDSICGAAELCRSARLVS